MLPEELAFKSKTQEKKQDKERKEKETKKKKKKKKEKKKEKEKETKKKNKPEKANMKDSGNPKDKDIVIAQAEDLVSRGYSGVFLDDIGVYYALGAGNEAAIRLHGEFARY